MALSVRSVEYFYARFKDEFGKGYQLLDRLAAEDINILAFSAVPFGPNHVEFTIFPDNGAALVKVGKKMGLTLTGPQHAILINGDDHLGAFAEIHKTLADAGVEIYASSGVTDGGGHYGYVIYFRETDHERAAKILGAQSTACHWISANSAHQAAEIFP